MTRWMSIFLCGVFSVTGAASPLSAVTPNNEGIRALKGKDHYEAFRHLVHAANESPFDPNIRLNLGLAYFANKEYDKAEAEDKLAAQMASNDPKTAFMGWFNAAVAMTQKGEIPRALADYQMALEYNPTSIETKTNIELLWQGQGKKGGGGPSQQPSQSKNDPSKNSQGGKKDQDKNHQVGANQQDQQPQKNQPQPFKSKDLTKDTVRKILEEIQSQEQHVRAEDYSRGAKERPLDKDW